MDSPRVASLMTRPRASTVPSPALLPPTASSQSSELDLTARSASTPRRAGAPSGAAGSSSVDGAGAGSGAGSGSASGSDAKPSDNIVVSMRIRPLHEDEHHDSSVVDWQYNKTSVLENSVLGKVVHTYDRVFPPGSTNAEVYEGVAKGVIDRVLGGTNATVFAYGQTGSGKTFTMLGTPEEPGVIWRAVKDVFDTVASRTDRDFKFKVSYFEVYNEEINDLLQRGPQGRNLKVLRDDPRKGAIIEGLSERAVTNIGEVEAVVTQGEANRHYGSTNLNAGSSRSHTIFRMDVESRASAAVQQERKKRLEEFAAEEEERIGWHRIKKADISDADWNVAFLNLVDLAGSERQATSGTSGRRLKEGGMINKSLSALALVVSKLGEVGKGRTRRSAAADFIPYRNSKLTRLLRQSLGGNAFTSILCTMSPASDSKDESISTLKFAKTCKTIKNHASRNNRIMDDKTLLKQYKLRILDLKQQVKAVEERERQARDAVTMQTAVLEAQTVADTVTRRCELLEGTVQRLQAFIVKEALEHGPLLPPERRVDVLSHPHKSRSRSFQALGLKERHAAELDARYEAEVEAALAGKASAGAGSGGGKGLGGQKLEDIDPEATAAAARQAAKSHARKAWGNVRAAIHHKKKTGFDDVVMSLKKKEEKHGVQLAAMQRTQEALQLRAATLRKREEAASRELTRATGQAKVREEELRVLRESKRKQVTRISQLEKQLRTVKADLKATNTAKAWADQTVESLRSRLKALEAQVAAQGRLADDLQQLRLAKDRVDAELNMEQQRVAELTAFKTSLDAKRLQALAARVAEDSRRTKALESRLQASKDTTEAARAAATSMQQQAQEALNSARQQEEQAAARLAACEKECRHAEQAASARLAEVQRREAACEKRSTELTVWQQELHQRVTALDTQDAELEEREEQLEAELAQHRAEVHAVTTQHRSEVAEAHAEIASSRMQLQQEMEALRRKQVASDKRAARALAATRLQAVWRADRDRLFAQRERTLAQREEELRRGIADLRERHTAASGKQQKLAELEALLSEQRQQLQRDSSRLAARERRVKEQEAELTLRATAIENSAQAMRLQEEEHNKRAEQLQSQTADLAARDAVTASLMGRAKDLEANTKAKAAAVSLAAVALDLDMAALHGRREVDSPSRPGANRRYSHYAVGPGAGQSTSRDQALAVREQDLVRRERALEKEKEAVFALQAQVHKLEQSLLDSATGTSPMRASRLARPPRTPSTQANGQLSSVLAFTPARVAEAAADSQPSPEAALQVKPSPMPRCPRDPEHGDGSVHEDMPHVAQRVDTTPSTAPRPPRQSHADGHRDGDGDGDGDAQQNTPASTASVPLGHTTRSLFDPDVDIDSLVGTLTSLGSQFSK